MVLGSVDESMPLMFSFLLYGCLGPNLTKVQGLNVFGIDDICLLLFCKTKIQCCNLHHGEQHSECHLCAYCPQNKGPWNSSLVALPPQNVIIYLGVK